MEDYEKPLKQVNARIKRIVRQINAMTSDHYQRRAGGPKGSGDDLRQPTRGSFPDQQSMLKAIDRFQEKGDPTPTEKSKVKKLKSRLNKLFRQKKSLEKREGQFGDQNKPYQTRQSQRVGESKPKKKLRKLSLRGRGGGGSMKMPQEYAKPSLFRKN
tara:strand:+ start:129 stop:599 length:471 start_codon:yes stop_codon:yes gene_type:complete